MSAADPLRDLSWRYTFNEPGPDFVLVRARAGEPETIGRVRRYQPIHETTEAWAWSLTSQARPVGIDKPTFPTHGSQPTQRGARDALVAAWRQEAAFRAACRESPAFAQMGPYMRDFLVNGQPVPPGLVESERKKAPQPEGRGAVSRAGRARAATGW